MMKNELNSRRAFTLIELLTVIAVIGILAGILIPTVGAVRNSAKKAKSKSQFSQIVTAFDLFRQEYGYYPKFGAGATNVFVFDTNADAQKFSGTFTGKALDGSAATTVNLNGNKKKMGFYSFGGDDLSSSTLSSAELQDSFGNTQLGIMVDSNGDGLIKTADDGTPLPVTSVDGGTFTPAAAEIPTDGVRAGVLIYSAGKGTTGTIKAADAVMSWK